MVVNAVARPVPRAPEVDKRLGQGAGALTRHGRRERCPPVVTVKEGAVAGDDGIKRCWWGNSPAEYRLYHDNEWGRPVGEEDRIFEKLCLEGFQSGLSWLTVLRKREGFRRAFANFDPEVVARFGPADVQRLLSDASIIRHRAKIEADYRATPALSWNCAPRANRWPAWYGLTRSRPEGRLPAVQICRLRHNNRRSYRRNCAGSASASSAPRPCTRRCSPLEW